MPVLRSAMACARVRSREKASRRASMTTKSLPRPCILTKAVVLMVGLIWRAAPACPMVACAPALPRSAPGGGACDPLADQLGAVVGPDPAHDRDPFPLLQVFVMLEEVSDLVAQDLRQVLIGFDAGIIGVEGIDRHRDDFLVGTGLVLHQEGAD